jgi:tripartite-type tricarboxylate transporter receptor subunit TctC
MKIRIAWEGQMEAKGKLFVWMIAIGFIWSWGFQAAAQEFPTKPITLYLCHPPGGTTDVVTRPLANVAKQYLNNQPFIFDNRGGGGGTIAPSIVANKPPDGYNISVMTKASLISYQMGKLTFNPITDVTPIVTYTAALQGIVVRADAPWKNIQELIEYSKKNPGKLSYGSAGVGTTAHLPIEKLCMDAGLKWIHIPYSGTGEQAPALLGGHIDILSGSSPSWIPLERAKKFRLLATYGPQRSSRYPHIPTLKDIGYDVVEVFSQQLVAPKGTPNPIIRKLEAAFLKAMNDREWLALLDNYDMMPLFYLNAEDSAKQNKKDFDNYEFLVEKLGLKGK